MIKGKVYIRDMIRYTFQKGFFHLLSANLLIQLFAFASQLFVAGILNPEDIGRIKILQIYFSVFSIIAGMGLNVSTLKLCSENRPLAEKIVFFKSALLLTLFSTTILYILILFLNFFGIFSSDRLIQLLLPLGLFPVISNSLFMVFVAYFQGIKKIKLISKLTIANKSISIVSIIIFTYWLNIQGYYIAYNLSFILILVFCFRIYRRYTDDIKPLTGLKSHFSEHWKYSKSSLFANLLSETSAYMDILLINFIVHDMKEIGFYSFAITMTIVLRLFPGTVQQIAAPYFSALAHQKPDFLNAFKKYNRILYIGVGITLIIVWVIITPLIQTIFNGKYDTSISFFLILSVGWSVRQLIQLQSGAIFGMGKIHYNAYISLISLLSNIIIYSLSIYYYGLTGAAYASIPSGIIIWIASRYFFIRAKKEMI